MTRGVVLHHRRPHLLVPRLSHEGFDKPTIDNNVLAAPTVLDKEQDRDESEQSLCKCLPVVSFSIGDAAEFLYGEQRDVDRANKVILESGDVLIFGGKSRHVFHGASSIKPDTAPKTLLEKTNLRSGRLNLTFKEY